MTGSTMAYDQEYGQWATTSPHDQGSYDGVTGQYDHHGEPPPSRGSLNRSGGHRGTAERSTKPGNSERRNQTPHKATRYRVTS